jgi:hypothetical protein
VLLCDEGEIQVIDKSSVHNVKLEAQTKKGQMSKITCTVLMRHAVDCEGVTSTGREPKATREEAIVQERRTKNSMSLFNENKDEVGKRNDETGQRAIDCQAVHKHSPLRPRRRSSGETSGEGRRAPLSQPEPVWVV